MKPYKVIELLSAPKALTFKMFEAPSKYYGVTVVLQHEDDIHESTVTFEGLEEAQKLKVGDVFYR